MESPKKVLRKLIEDIPDNEAIDVIDFIAYLTLKRERRLSVDLLKSSESSLEFWNNAVDNEVWDNV